jgi:hypothetical protein
LAFGIHTRTSTVTHTIVTYSWIAFVAKASIYSAIFFVKALMHSIFYAHVFIMGARLHRHCMPSNELEADLGRFSPVKGDLQFLFLF